MTNQEIQTAQQASESDMRAIQNMFERAANAIVNASQLGKEVDALRVQVNTLVTDTNRLRETISWLEQENATLRTQRDEAQNTLSNLTRDFDMQVLEIKRANDSFVAAIAERDNARGEAKLWQEEAGSLEKDRNDLKAKVTHLTNMLDKIWSGIKDHFEVKPIQVEVPSHNSEPIDIVAGQTYTPSPMPEHHSHSDHF